MPSDIAAVVSPKTTATPPSEELQESKYDGEEAEKYIGTGNLFPVKPSAVSKRPILIDERDGLCDLCDHKTGICDKCKKSGYDSHMPSEMGSSGYQSIRPMHFHLTSVDTVPGRTGIFGEVCRDCYREEWNEVYPEKECPIS